MLLHMHAFRVVSLCVMYVLCRHVAGHVTPPPSGASAAGNKTPADAKILNAVGRNGSPAPQVGGTSREGSTQPSAAGFTASTPGIGGTSKKSDEKEEVTNVKAAKWFTDQHKSTGLKGRTKKHEGDVNERRKNLYDAHRKRVETNQTPGETQREKQHIENLRKKIPKRDRSPENEDEIEDRASKDPRRDSAASESDDLASQDPSGMPAAYEVPSDTLRENVEIKVKGAKTMEEARENMYKEQKDWNETWQGYSKQISTLTRHVVTLIDNLQTEFPEGSESVKDILTKQPLTAKLYNYILRAIDREDDLFGDLAESYHYDELAYEYLVIDAMNQDVTDLDADLFDNSDATSLDDWKLFLDTIEPDVVDRPKLLAMRLGADLHSSRDASADWLQNLSSRVQALQDW